MKGWSVGLVLLGLLLVNGTATAAVPSTLAHDFAPIDGLVLLARDGEVMVDASVEQGVRVGELFSIIAPGETIRHPVSGAVLGRLDKVSGVLAITQVRSGFATGRLLSGAEPAPGTIIRRFARVKAWFVDPAGRGEMVFSEVRAALPQLDWQPYTTDAAKPSKDGLLFTLQGSNLDVRGDGEMLHSYTLPAIGLMAAPVAVTPVSVPVVPLAVNAAPAKIAALSGAPVLAAPIEGTPAVAAAPQGAAVIVPQTAEAIEKQPSKWIGAAVDGVPVGLAIADLDGDGKNEVARLLADRLEIGRVTGVNYKKLQEIELVKGRDGLNLVAFDLNKNGKLELFVTAASIDEVRSTVFEFDGKKYRELADDQRWFINLVGLTDGPALLGQRRTPGIQPFAPTVHRLQWQGKVLAEGDAVSLPPDATVFAITSIPGAGTERFVRINNGGHLTLANLELGELWVSEQSGDTEIGFKQSEFLVSGGSEDVVSYIFLPAPLHLSADGLLLTAFNTGFTSSNAFRQMTMAEIVGWRWEGQELMPKWNITGIEGYVPAVTIADLDSDGVDELVMLLAYPNRNPFGSRRSVIRTLALN
jgi:hypothetical protein